MYIYIPGTGLSSILGFEPSKKKALSIQNKGHLGSRYIYIYVIYVYLKVKIDGTDAKR